ncbi:MAG: prepilin peptidase [Candidatus Moranbacteria bacterium]|nr:prepilin peptidase [Candidatus Moranbacteria bacterium]
MLIIFFLFGLIIGSFLNVLVYRIQTAETILGRSHCRKCKKTIAWYDNIPLLSFILLKFKCRECGEKISWQYPLVEFFTGVIFALLASQYFALEDMTTWITTGAMLFFASALVVIFVYDVMYMEIPSLVLWPAVVLALAFDVYSDLGTSFFSIWDRSLISGLIAAVVAFLFFFSLSFFSREKWMGMGDAYLVVLLGLILGWPKILLGLFLAFAIGAVYGLVLIALKKKKMKSQLPFAPFLIIGTLLTLFYYFPITEWYLSFF